MSGQQHARGVRLFFAMIAMLVAAGCEPTFVFAGGELAGTERPMPSDWGFTEDFGTVQIETRPTDPYSVNVWGVSVNRNFYVAASDASDAAWARAIETEPQVRLRIGDDIYPLLARRTEDPEELADVADAYIDKYGGEPERSFIRHAWVFRLGSR
ncbi:MAG: hypothetical protein OXH68_04275 [Gammaproteobacteria bacterium]|nr:hypothetical protein [Gammaproteobacteria bacterium]